MIYVRVVNVDCSDVDYDFVIYLDTAVGKINFVNVFKVAH